MGGLFSAGGLITGIDSNSLISQLVQLERQPIMRMQQRISSLEAQRNAVRDIRSQLTTLRGTLQDFRLTSPFDQYTASSSEEKVATVAVTGETPVIGAFSIEAKQLATATAAESSAQMGAVINQNQKLDINGMETAVTAGTFSINGVEFTVDPAADSLKQALQTINNSAANVTASYDTATGRITIANKTSGDTSLIVFGAESDTSNFLDAIHMKGASQIDNAQGATSVTSSRHLGAVNPGTGLGAVSFADGAITAGAFSINGVSISVDPATDALSDVIDRINSSEAGVSASYDSANDTIRVVSDTLGSRTIRFGGASDTSNFLAVTNLDTATQIAGQDAIFSVNGGADQTSNTNDLTTAINGLTISLLSQGTTSINSARDDAGAIEAVKGFITEFNAARDQLRAAYKADGKLKGDSTIRSIDSFMRNTIFNRIEGLGGDYESLAQIGITTGSDFDSSGPQHLQFDEEKFKEALGQNRLNVEKLFVNEGETGIFDQLFTYTDEATKTSGYLNSRIKSNGLIDEQISNINDRIDRTEARVLQYEERLRRQFSRLEQMASVYQNQGAAMSSLQFGSF